VESHLIMSNKRARTTFKYNERGDVVEKFDMRDLTAPNKTQWWVFKYDKLGNLLEEDIYRNDKHVYHREVLYDEKTMLLKVLITKDMEANYITILKYNYQYY
jgi:antitoxin component YwqK of YwqJK toxin-antitoxin module